jgi:hypothetical protein
VVSTACDSASITSIVSKIINMENRKVGWVGDDSHVFGKNNCLVKKEVREGVLS